MSSEVQSSCRKMSGVQFNAMEPDIAASTKEAKYDEAVPEVEYDEVIPKPRRSRGQQILISILN